ncbi:MAG TPA: chromate efflux transporter [Quisquiliibacterium sp.]|nr:chromate efflux transporter [Quisquiliibacterium sp.]
MSNESIGEPSGRGPSRARGEAPGRVLEVFVAFLRLGLVSFGGPVAHLGYFREAFVMRRRWLSEAAYADLVALCQFLPGPASSQVGMALGLSRAGLPGALAAWAGFTLPSALALTLFALGVGAWGEGPAPGLLQGLKLAAVAVVAQAVWGMGRSLCPDAPRATMAVAAACAALAWNSPWTQVGVIAIAAAIGLAALRAPATEDGHAPLPATVGRGFAVAMLAAFLALLVGLPALAQASPGWAASLFDAFYRAGALVFGGGHVVLPLLQAEVVGPGWVSAESFLAGYGAAQAVPGPLFTFAAYLGAAAQGWAGAAVALAGIFLPAFLLVLGALPFWDRLRRQPGARAALSGVNAAVVGLLLAALYDPVWTSAVRGPADFAQALAAFVAPVFWRAPPWAIVIASAALGWARMAVPA